MHKVLFLLVSKADENDRQGTSDKQQHELIDSPKIRTLAERAAWLGNDETHYLKRHVDYSYLDIKDFLEAMVAFIQYEKTVDKAAAIPRI